MAAVTNAVAKTFKALHKPGQPVVLANVYDTLTARTVAAMPSSKALATASYAVALANESKDGELTLEQNLSAVRGIVKVAKEFNKPLTVDAQDAYGPRLEETVSSLIDLGVVGMNLEDSHPADETMYSKSEAVDRIKRALKTANEKGVPDFVVNARCDTLRQNEFSDVLDRGKAYLEAGATTVFVIPGKRGIKGEDVAEMVKEFGGMLNVGPGALTVKQLAELGLARISVGPMLQIKAMKTFSEEAEKLLTGV
jgi:2-methylisocitrate lyase-like PEP mutase family enzyme